MNTPKKKVGRKSKIPEGEREKIRARLMRGDTMADIARDYGVDPKVIQRMKHLAKQEGGETRLPVGMIKQAAEKSLENDLRDPVVRNLLEIAGQSDRDLFYNHKNDLLEITMQLNLSCKFSAQNAHKLAAMAHNHLSKLETTALLDSESKETLNKAMVLQDASNESAKQPMKLFEIATKQPPPPPEDKPLRIIGGLPEVPYE